MRVSVSDLMCFQRYRDTEYMELEECLAQLRRERPPTPEMMAGSALHAALEHSAYDVETNNLTWGDYVFLFECEVELCIPDVRELKGEMPVITPSGLVTFVGVVDSIGNEICDYKLSGKFDAERLADSWQWRCYLWMFERLKFTYKVFVGEQIGLTTWAIKDYQEISFYRYPGMEEKIKREIEECAAFMKRYLIKAA